MNKYERALMRQVPPPTQIVGYFRRTYPVYTREGAIQLAAELPGLQSPVTDRIAWLMRYSEDTLFAATLTGLQRVCKDDIR